ncbi:MAG TPA: aminopeptidase P N-terminal domain-containing protein, partial [Gemmatimonadaceae bacterium]|nr:aminopeptidase P N-terminal domain-containing protein [Gemmatimonadaceae bacterium]
MKALVLVALCVATVAAAQVPEREFAARRDSLAKRIDSGVVIAFGGRTPINDFGTFHQLPAFHYLTNFDDPDAALVMVVRKGVGSSTLFLTPADPRRAFYYGWRPDSADVKKVHGLNGRSFGALRAVADSLASTGLPFYTLDDFEDADFSRADSLTRGREFARGLAARHAGLIVRDAHSDVDQLRAKKSPSEIALLKKAAEISSEGHRAAMLAP